MGPGPQPWARTDVFLAMLASLVAVLDTPSAQLADTVEVMPAAAAIAG